MVYLYSLFQGVLDATVVALGSIGDGGTLALISAVAGIILVLLYKQVSAQETIARTKRAIGANILESVLFRSDIRVSLLAQLRSFLLGLKYAALAVPALIVLAIPALLVLGALFPYFAVDGVTPLEPLIVTAEVKDVADLDKLSLRLEGAGTVTEPVRIPESREIAWRVTTTPSDSESVQPAALVVSVDGVESRIPLKVSPFQRAESYLPLSVGWLTGARIVPPSLSKKVETFQVNYRTRDVNWLGMQWNWLVLFFVVSLVAGLAISKVAGVEI